MERRSRGALRRVFLDARTGCLTDFNPPKLEHSVAANTLLIRYAYRNLAAAEARRVRGGRTGLQRFQVVLCQKSRHHSMDGVEAGAVIAVRRAVCVPVQSLRADQVRDLNYIPEVELHSGRWPSVFSHAPFCLCRGPGDIDDHWDRYFALRKQGAPTYVDASPSATSRGNHFRRKTAIDTH